ncbi:NAD-dependent epimerase/dehydratase family protein [Cupriavidus respiraculi]|uniref:dTDP-4-dehydro-6-deoxyglucose reductase n=1 Tax=Cupriavidus respiraculi TaxID=195930 RepID=A0ABM8XCM2_9BURK|nr:NAD-dependent epimerase/dehydratase family protein [Cupriavidus respiraculi]CAG9177772.1 dTDP-4-dehydro-6-deoxyglucose reductase [Cupriavidus respiraculi]
MTQVAVIGGSGFIGKPLVRQLAEAGCRVHALGITPADCADADQQGDAVRWFCGDFQDEALVRSVMEGADTVFHLVSTTLPRSSNEDPVYDITSNVGGTLKLLRVAVECRVRKVVFLSSGGTIYGPPQFLPITEDHPLEPNCSYGVGKMAIEKYLQLFHTQHGLEYAVVRLSNPFGAGQPLDRAQGAVSVFLDRILRKVPIEIWGDGSVVRDYIYISDAVDGIVAAARYEGGRGIYNIGSGVGHSLNEVIAEIERVSGEKATVVYQPARVFDVPINVLSIARAQQELGFAPRVPFREGIRKTLEWLRG